MKKILYNFLWLHSILTWLFIFFIPVFLYKNWFSLSEISYFISLTWLSFVISMLVWDRIRYKGGIRILIVISFFLEIWILCVWTLDKNFLFLFLFSIIYWVYNCFFWLTKRVLFVSSTEKHEVWDKFWNIQIIAFVLVKIGILLWSYLLGNNHYDYVLVVSILLSAYGVYYFVSHKKLVKNLEEFSQASPVSLKKVFLFKDRLRSKYIFMLDGPFLFFESFFWLLSLFLITGQSYHKLWILVVVLAIVFSVIFIWIKKKIDKVQWQQLLYVAVILYAFSWIFRWYVGNLEDNYVIYLLVLVIAFCTSFFRLVFNKQFFHTAKSVDTHSYMMMKSYYSQFFIFFIFWVLALIFYNTKWSIEISLMYVYYILAPISLLFILYKPLWSSQT